MGQKKLQIRRVVLDTHVIVSALLFSGPASKPIGQWKTGTIIPLVSAETMKEVIRVLAYPKFNLSQDEIKSILHEELLPYIKTVKIKREINGVCADASDDIFLSCAVNGKAEAIISGDIHLLSLKQFEGIPIIKISEFTG